MEYDEHKTKVFSYTAVIFSWTENIIYINNAFWLYLVMKLLRGFCSEAEWCLKDEVKREQDI